MLQGAASARRLPLGPASGASIGVASFSAPCFRRAPSWCGSSSSAILIIVLLGPRSSRCSVAGRGVRRPRAARSSRWCSGYVLVPVLQGEDVESERSVDGHASTSTGSRTRREDHRSDPAARSRSTSSPTGGSPSNPLDNVLIVGAGNRHRRRDRARPTAPSTSTPSRSTRGSTQIGEELHPDHAVPGPAGHRPHQRRPGLPRANGREVRPHPVRPARLADPGRRASRSCAWRATCSRERGDRVRPRAPRARRRIRDVQLLPRALARRSARATPLQAAFGHDPCIDLLSSVRAVIVRRQDRGGPDLRDRRAGGDPRVRSTARSRPRTTDRSCT